tara:strand:- start:1854 stop:2015 length:162 start_codon:yes stop_codon:yes gene_type:complete
MEQLITTLGELEENDLKWFLYKNNSIKTADDLITFLYNLNQERVKEIINELNK